MQFPFTEDEEGGLIGQVFNIYENELFTNTFSFLRTITFLDNNRTAQGGQWKVKEEILHIMDDTGDIQFSFDGVGIIKGRFTAVGFQVANVQMKRVVMKEYTPLPNKIWEIRVSSCPAHSSKILSALLKSLRREKISESRIKVVVGSIPYSERFKSEIKKVEVFSSEQNLKGFTAVQNTMNIDPCKYYMLLHDTCKVVEGFKEWINNVDVGLNPDIILLRPPEEGLEIGLYSGSFLLDQDDLDTVKPEERLHFLIGRASVVIVVGGHKIRKEPTDYYGEGKMRQELIFSRSHIQKLKNIHSTRRK